MPHLSSSIPSSLPFLLHVRKQAKLSVISALKFFSDPGIRELFPLREDSEVLERLSIPRSSYNYNQFTNQYLTQPMLLLSWKPSAYSRSSMQNSGLQHLNHSWSKASSTTLLSWNQNLEPGTALLLVYPSNYPSFFGQVQILYLLH